MRKSSAGAPGIDDEKARFLDTVSAEIGSNRGMTEAYIPASGVRWRDRLLLAHARGPEYRGKVRIFHWLSRALIRSRLQVRHACPAIVEIDPADFIPWEIVRNGSYEPESLNLALSLMRAQPGLFVDVGANFGLFTCAIATLPGVRVISLEPDAANYAELGRNIARNGFSNVTIKQIAASAEPGLVQLIRRSARNSGTIALRSPSDPASEGEWIAAKPLRDILKEATPENCAPALVKIDVEGFERMVLDGLDLATPERPRNIIFEYTPQLAAHSWRSFDEVREYFSRRSYLLADVSGQEIRDERQLLESNVWARTI